MFQCPYCRFWKTILACWFRARYVMSYILNNIMNYQLYFLETELGKLQGQWMKTPLKNHVELWERMLPNDYNHN